jgi:hypothetical protein
MNKIFHMVRALNKVTVKLEMCILRRLFLKKLQTFQSVYYFLHV